MIHRSYDATDSIIQVRSVGAATRAEIDEHYHELRRLIAAIRGAGKPVRVLSDQTEAAWLPDELNLHIKAQIERTYRPGDRLALLMPSGEAKVKAREVLGVTEYAVFNSRTAAEIWLMEPSLKPPSAS